MTPISSKNTKKTQRERIRAIGSVERICAQTIIAPIAMVMFWKRTPLI
jgi:hypothetical protein